MAPKQIPQQFSLKPLQGLQTSPISIHGSPGGATKRSHCNMRKFIKNARRRMQDERGITGLETAIILIAFVVVATVFAFIVLTTGIFSAERGKETVFAGLQKARGTMEIRGGVVALAATPPTVDSFQFSVSTTAGGDPIPLDPTATTQRTVIAYRDADVSVNDVPYTTTNIV